MLSHCVMKLNKTIFLYFITLSGLEKPHVCLKIKLVSKLNLCMIFIAPAYSRVRYRSPNFCPSVRSSVRSSVNIYVEVWFS